MLLNSKKKLIDTFNLNSLPRLKNNDNIDNNDNSDDSNEYLYTTTIVKDKFMTSNFEYNGIPSKSSIKNINDIDNMNNTTINDNEVFYNTGDTEIKINKIVNKIMIYSINKEREIPFLLYLLKYDRTNNNYNSIDINIDIGNNINEIEKYILREFDLTTVNYKGIIIYNDINYLFFESIKPIDVSFYNKEFVWTLISEIVNYKKIYNIDIDKTITDLFLKHNCLLNLKHVDGTIYESPTVGYSIDNEIDTLYFNCDYNIIKNIIKNEKYIKRYAIFLGYMKFNQSDQTNYKFFKYNSVYNLLDSSLCEMNYIIRMNDESQYIFLTKINNE